MRINPGKNNSENFGDDCLEGIYAGYSGQDLFLSIAEVLLQGPEISAFFSAVREAVKAPLDTVPTLFPVKGKY